MRIKLSAVIPTVQYGNLQPEFEVENDDPIVGMAALEELVQRIWDKYGEKPLVAKAGTAKRIEAFVGGAIDYDEVNHIYSWNGEKYLSGSEYAGSKKKPFDSKAIAEATAKKFNVSASDVADVWTMSGKLSRDFGTVLHTAMEMYGKYRELAKAMGKEYHISSHPLLKQAVESFYKGREDEEAKYEVVVVDHEAKRAGTIDRLVLSPKSCVIQDFKITTKEDKEYWRDQLEFYEGILKAGGWAVTGKEIHQYNGEWKEIKL